MRDTSGYKDRWFTKCLQVHGDKFDYSLVEYKGTKSKVLIFCKKHEQYFEVAACNHIRAATGGCPKCIEEIRSISEDELIFTAQDITKKKVEVLEYKGTKSKLRIFCKEHGWYTKRYNKLLYEGDVNCPECKKPDTRKLKQNNYQKKWIEKANKVHGGKFDYSDMIFVDVRTPIIIRCKKHNLYFEQRPMSHLETKHCCPQCARESMRATIEEFKNKALIIHKGKYLYDELDFSLNADSNRYDVTVTCPKHGNFQQAAHVHLSGYGCPVCASHLSKPEIKIREFVSSTYEVVSNTRRIIPPKELDIYIPELSLAIEYNGLRYHSELYREDAKLYHLRKTEECEKKGIQLLHVFEDEFLYREDVVMSKIGYFLNAHTKIAARKTKVITIDSKNSRSFLNMYHLQGADNAPVRLGLEYQGELVAVMTFSRPLISGGDRSFEWSLSRFCTKSWVSVTGGFSKLFMFFIREYNPKSIQTFADRRWSLGNIYINNGFRLLRVTPPNYWYVDMKNRRRVHRFHFRKDRLPKLLDGFDPSLTEVENMHNHGVYRIWDSGNLVYGWYKED